MKIFAMHKGHKNIKRLKKCREAAFSYMGAKTGIAVLSFFFIPCTTCTSITKFIIRTLLHIFIIGHFISIGFRFTLYILTSIYVLIASYSLVNFFVPINLELPVPFMGNWQVMDSSRFQSMAIFVKVILSSFIVFMLVRALNEIKMNKMESLSNE